jgi:hypothetical protein
MFYNNINIASTYLLGLSVFVVIMISLKAYRVYSSYRQSAGN